MDYNQAIEFLQSFPDSERGLPGAKPGRHLKMPLSTMLSLLEVLGNPQNNTKTIHITGSKGKGSTATFITSILNKAAFKTALFTSPHLHSYTERIAFDLKPVDQDIFAQGVSKLKPYIEDFDKQGHIISTFGILTALFFYLVSKASPPIDWQIVEVGLGGKDDLTNVFARKEAVVITPISLEHTAILGPTPAAIAENKAGIITPNCLTVLATQQDVEVKKTIKNICASKNAQLFAVDDLPIDHKILPQLQMPGDHQIANALTASTLARTLSQKGHKISEKAIEDGLSSAFLPGRFEVIATSVRASTTTIYSRTTNSIVKSDSDITIPIILDGAHNDDSARALATTLETVFPSKPVLFILGINQDKNLEDLWQALKNKACAIIATRSDSYRAVPPEEIRERLNAIDPNAQITCAKNIDQALEKTKSYLLDNNQNDSIICICGSLYLVAEAREILLGNQLQPTECSLQQLQSFHRTTNVIYKVVCRSTGKGFL